MLNKFSKEFKEIFIKIEKYPQLDDNRQAMADFATRYADNSPGAFFVDQSCIACDTCGGVAPDHFKLDLTFDHAFVYTQPASKSEIDLCKKALELCPVQAIGEVE